MHRNRLAAKVAAVNKAHTFAPQLYEQLVSVFKDFVGKPVEKVDGSLLAKVKNALPELPCTPGLQVYRVTSTYSLAWSVKVNENYSYSRYGGQVGQSCEYYERTVYIGELKGNILTKLGEKPNGRTDYTVAEIEAKRAKAAAAKKIYDEAQSDCFPFGEHDNG